jgi:hypothetical protein
MIDGIRFPKKKNLPSVFFIDLGWYDGVGVRLFASGGRILPGGRRCGHVRGRGGLRVGGAAWPWWLGQKWWVRLEGGETASYMEEEVCEWEELPGPRDDDLTTCARRQPPLWLSVTPLDRPLSHRSRDAPVFPRTVLPRPPRRYPPSRKIEPSRKPLHGSWTTPRLPSPIKP